MQWQVCAVLKGIRKASGSWLPLHAAPIPPAINTVKHDQLAFGKRQTHKGMAEDRNLLHRGAWWLLPRQHNQDTTASRRDPRLTH